VSDMTPKQYERPLSAGQVAARSAAVLSPHGGSDYRGIAPELSRVAKDLPGPNLRRHFLGRNPGQLAKMIIREILGLSLFDGFQDEVGYEFGLVSFGVIG
jgi:hypothetical protein